jgi:hypothetical protein
MAFDATELYVLWYKCVHLILVPNQLSRTDLPNLIKGLKIEVARLVLGSLTHICIQKLLKVGNRSRRRAVIRVPRVRRVLSRILLD